MEPDLAALDSYLAERGTDGYLFDATSADSDHRYVSGFDAHDPFVTLYTPGGTHLLVKELEYGRAVAESRADTVSKHSAYDEDATYGPREARYGVVADFLADHGVESVSVSARFPVGTADGLRERGVAVEPETGDVITGIRAVKTDEEIGHVGDVQAANATAMAAAEELIAAAAIEDGTLVLDGEALTSEHVKEEIEVTLLRDGCTLEDTIVACGADAAEPHNRGSGPLRAGEPIVVDIFPRSKATNYHGDMTRTFVRGEPDERAREWYDLTHEAFEAALAAVEPGATGADVYDATCDVFEDAGLPTLRSDPGTETGFIHSTGHGVGLDVHELPRIAAGADEPLQPGHVVTIEPGLYDPAVGGIRIEDLVVVTEDGYENLTDYPVEFVA